MPRRSGWRVALAASTVSLIAAAPLVAVEPALAQPYPPGPSLQLDDTTLSPGDEVDFVATGFQPHEEVESSLVPVDGDGGAAGAAGSVNTAALRGSAAFPAPLLAVRAPSDDGDDDHGDDGDDGRTIVPLGTHFADANGRVVDSVTIPEDTKPGKYDFTLEGLESGLVLTARVTIEDDRDDHGDDDHGDDHGRPGHGDDDDHGRPGHGDDDHGRPGHRGGEDDDHGRSGHGDDDHGRSGHGDHDDSYGEKGNHDDSGSGGKSSDHDGSSLAETGSSDATTAMLAAAGGLVLLGGGSLVLVKRRRTAGQQQ